MTPLSRRSTFAFLGLFILLSLVTILRHEMWRDELQAWLLCSEQASLARLFHAVRYEKHPTAWYVLLFCLTRITRHPLAMQLFHLVLATISAWLVLRFAPFSEVHKVLLIFGYYLFFEYNVISRNYALGVLALFLFCCSYARGDRKLLAQGACLFVLANSSIFGLILAMAAGALLLIDVLGDENLRRKWASFAALIFVGLGGLISLFSLRPMADASYDQASRVHAVFHAGLLERVLRILPETYFQVPRPTFHFWNTHLLDPVPRMFAVSAVLALACFVMALFSIRKSRSATVFYLLGTTGILAWLYVGSVGFARHRGHLFLVLIAALWLAGRGKSQPSSGRPVVSSAVLTVILVAQAAGGLFAAGMDIVHPFSQAKAVARYIKENGYADLPIVGEMDYLMTPVSGYLGRKIYFVRGERLGSYVKWDMRRFQDVTPAQIIERAEQFTWKKRKDCLILLGFHLDPRWERPGYLTKLTVTGRAIVAGEVYRLYLLKYRGPREEPGH